MEPRYEYDKLGEMCLGNAQGHLWCNHNDRCISCGQERYKNDKMEAI